MSTQEPHCDRFPSPTEKLREVPEYSTGTVKVVANAELDMAECEPEKFFPHHILPELTSWLTKTIGVREADLVEVMAYCVDLYFTVPIGPRDQCFGLDSMEHKAEYEVTRMIREAIKDKPYLTLQSVRAAQR